MPTATCGNGAFTPSTSQDNWVVDTTPTGAFGKVIAIGWGGRMTTSTAYRTRWYRPSTVGSSTFTALTAAFHQPNYTSMQTRFGTWGVASSPPTDPAGNLYAQDWNAQGGMGMIVMPLANPWWYVNGVLTGDIACRNVAGTDASSSSYEVTVEE